MRHSIRVVRGGRFVLAALALCVLLTRPVRAQVIGEAVELERTGRHDRAAVVYLAVLRGEPTNLAALLALGAARRFDEARAVLGAGQRALGGSRAGALAVELADLAARRGDWEDAARQWGRAATAAPDQLPNAAAQLADVAPGQRDRVTR